MENKSPIPTYKKALVGWLAIYPVITLLIYALHDTVNSLPVYLQTLIITAIAVPLMSFIVMPFFHKLFFRAGH